MDQEKIIFERDKLHQLVWSKPMVHLAKEFNLSNNGLKKICKRLEIPIPPAGYWLKKQRENSIPPLPPATRQRPKLAKVYGPLDDQLACYLNYFNELIEYESLEENKIRYQHPKTYHPIVKQTIRALRKGHLIAGNEFLDINVSPRSLLRSARLLSSLFAELGKRDIKLRKSQAEIQKQHYVLAYMGEYEFQIFEKSDNKLIFKLDMCGDIKKFEDKDGLQLEQQFFDILMAIYSDIKAYKIAAYEDLKQQEKANEPYRIREEEKRLLQVENQNIKLLLDEVSSWQKSKAIREYANAFREKLLQQNESIGPDSQKENRFSWMIEVADKLDPFTAKPPING